MDWEQIGPSHWQARLTALGLIDDLSEVGQDDSPTVVVDVWLDKGEVARFDIRRGAGGGLTARGMRKLPLGDVIQNAVWANEAVVRKVPVERRKGRTGYDRAHYEKVAATYLLGVQLRPHSPITYVSEALDVPASTARRWITRCRRMEPPLLPPGRNRAQAQENP